MARPFFRAALVLGLLAGVASLRVLTSHDVARTADSAPLAAPPFQTTYAALGRDAAHRLVSGWYTDGGWLDCRSTGCHALYTDWGADALTYALWLRYATTHDDTVQGAMQGLLDAARPFRAPCRDRSCRQWSDVPMWDAVALLREGDVTGDRERADALAARAFDAVADTDAYARGACPSVSYQAPYGRGNGLKTLETDANYVKAALLLYRDTHRNDYLRLARQRYAAARSAFLDRATPLYTVYVFDDGSTCRQARHRFFASVNGLMIWNGLELARDTHDGRYRTQALATAHAVDASLSDDAGIYANLQAENDVAEPLVEAMYRAATDEHERFARAWIVRNAEAAAAARTAEGDYGRFFDGPPPLAPITAWQTNGGFALAIAAAALDPHGTATPPDRSIAHFVPAELATLPSTLTFTGSAVAVIGTLGERCCENGHAHVSIDGTELADATGIWQSKSSSGLTLPETILFAWRWPKAGTHVLRFEPPEVNAKEGGAFLHVSGYFVQP